MDSDVSEENYASVFNVEVQQTVKIEAVCFSETSVSRTRPMVSQLRRLHLTIMALKISKFTNDPKVYIKST